MTWLQASKVKLTWLDIWLRHHRKNMGVAKSAAMSADLQHMRQLEKQVTGCVDTLTTTCLAQLITNCVLIQQGGDVRSFN